MQVQFTVNGKATLCFVNVNELLGFEVGDLTTGKKLHRVVIEGFATGKPKRHGCPFWGAWVLFSKEKNDFCL